MRPGDLKAVGGEVVNTENVVKQGGVTLGPHVLKNAGDSLGQGDGFAENALYAIGDHGVERSVRPGVEPTEERLGLADVSYDSHERSSPAMTTNRSIAWAR